MLAYADGDIGAFLTLYERHKKRIFGYLFTKLKNRSEADDVFQSVFTKLHIARQKYRKEIPFLPWIFTITKNNLLDYLRKKSTYTKHIAISEKEVERYADPTSDTAHNSVAISELSSLTAAQRQVLELRFNEGLTFREISAQMQTTEDNTRQIISRAIRKVRKLMGGNEVRHGGN